MKSVVEVSYVYTPICKVAAHVVFPNRFDQLARSKTLVEHLERGARRQDDVALERGWKRIEVKRLSARIFPVAASSSQSLNISWSGRGHLHFRTAFVLEPPKHLSLVFLASGLVL